MSCTLKHTDRHMQPQMQSQALSYMHKHSQNVLFLYILRSIQFLYTMRAGVDHQPGFQCGLLCCEGHPYVHWLYSYIAHPVEVQEAECHFTPV